MALLLRVLINPGQLARLNINQWQLLLAQAKASRLVGRLYYLVVRERVEIPEYAAWHLRSAYKLAERQRQQATREVAEINQALASQDVSFTLLKGAAYIVKGLPCCFGRIFSDIDILVARSEIEKVERYLRFYDWVQTKVDDYDEQYYRTWMHEIPPLRHAKRGTVLDVHHNILPLTNKDMPDFSRFKMDAVSVANVGEVQVLSNTDLCIHTAVHLFTESEFHHGLRDISDFDMLLRHFQENDADFVQALLDRALFLGLFDYVRLAVRYAHLVFGTPIANVEFAVLQAKYPLLGMLQDFCYINIFTPNHASCRTWRYGLSAWLLYWRGHLLRMPLRLLVPHLLRKTWMHARDALTKDETAQLEIPRN